MSLKKIFNSELKVISNNNSEVLSKFKTEHNSLTKKLNDNFEQSTNDIILLRNEHEKTNHNFEKFKKEVLDSNQSNSKKIDKFLEQFQEFKSDYYSKFADISNEMDNTKNRILEKNIF